MDESSRKRMVLLITGNSFGYRNSEDTVKSLMILEFVKRKILNILTELEIWYFTIVHYKSSRSQKKRIFEIEFLFDWWIDWLIFPLK